MTTKTCCAFHSVGGAADAACGGEQAARNVERARGEILTVGSIGPARRCRARWDGERCNKVLDDRDLLDNVDGICYECAAALSDNGEW